MRLIHFVMCLMVCMGLLVSSCEQIKSPTEASSSSQSISVDRIREAARGTIPAEHLSSTTCGTLLPQSVALSGFTVTYNGRTVANNLSTFSYTVTGPAVQMSFRLELPGCAPSLTAWSPSSGKQSSTDVNINPGIEWSPGVGSGSSNSFNFSVTYPGTVNEGMVLTSVKSSSTNQVGFIAGACARVYDIGGTAFTDANSNGILDGSETGISNATVTLLSPPSTFLCSTTTDANGGYLFTQLPGGDYIVQIDSNSVTSGTQTNYISATTAASLNVTVGPSSLSNNFGYYFKTDKLLNDLKFSTLATNGLTPGFWKKQLQSAVNGGGNPVVSKDSLIAYIARIRALLLSEPYQLGSGDGLRAALDILSRPIKTNLDALNQQLLALEFNHVSRHGIYATDPALQLQLIGWGEALLANPSAAASSTAFTTSISCTVCTATDVYNSINKSSGGGTGF